MPEWVVAALAAIGGLLMGVWRGTLTRAKREGQVQEQLDNYRNWLGDLEQRHREVERNYVTADTLRQTENRLIKALHDANLEWRRLFEEERKELRAIHSRLDRLNVPPSHGNGG